MQINVMMLNQDDPKKCTAAKLVRFGLAKKITSISSKTVLLHPFSSNTLLNKEKNILGMMPHPERMIDKYLSGDDGAFFFENLLNNLK